MNPRSIVSSAAVILWLVIATPGAAVQTQSTSRSCADVMESEVCTWVVMEGGAAVELGATIPIKLVEVVPADAEMVWPPAELGAVPLPAEAKTALGLDHLGINWEAHGHPPNTFLAPHFDFHFYNLTPDEVRSIDCADETKPARLPEQHVLPDIDVPGMGTLVGLCVPNMGMHAVQTIEASSSDLFEASMLIGYYRGEPAFFEPMVSQASLLAKQDFALSMPTVPALPAGVLYPSEFRAEYDEAGGQYRMIFTGFQAR
ncbi:MAG: hypothetical protein ABFS14_09890 [Gemmatimonadota bacterium]